MATEKIFRRVFSDFKGINLNSNVLIRQPDQAIDMVNLEVADDFSLRMRDGCSLLGQPIRSMGIANYIVGGVEQLICYGIENRHIASGTYVPHLYRLAAANLTLTRNSGSTGWNAYHFVDPDFGQWRFQISQGGLIIFSQLLGTGLSTTPYTLSQLAAAINAIVGTPFAAVVDWTWIPSGGGTGTTVPVLSNPHPFPELRAVYFPDQVGGTRWRYVKAITAGPNLVLEGLAATWQATYVIASPVGLGTLPAAILSPRSPELGEQSALSVQALSFPYWEPIPSHQYNTAGGGYQEIVPSGVLAGGIIPTSYGPINFTQSRNILYFSGSKKNGTAIISSTNTAQYTRSDLSTPTPITVFRGVHKYDGAFSYMTSNYYEPTISTAAHNAGFAATWTLGSLYRYRVLIRSKDAQGNVVISASTLPFAFTIANAVQGIQLTLLTRAAISQLSGIFRSSVFTSSGSTASAITLSGAVNNAIFRVGDRVAVLGPDPTLGFRWESRFGSVTAWNGATGTVTCQMDTGNYTTVPTGARTVSSFISANEAVVEIYRTKSNQNIFYLCGQVPLFYDTAATTTFVDDVTDANLGRVYDGPVDDFGNPTLNLSMGIATSLAAHQGVIAHIGENDNLRWDDGDFIERWIPARAELEVSSTTPGQVTGLVSDQNAQLIATKPESVIAITGSLPENQANTNVLVENFRGSGSQSSLVPVLGKVFGCGQQGPFTLEQGQLSVGFADSIQPAFTFGNQSFLCGQNPFSVTAVSAFGIGTDFSRLTVTPDVTKHRVLIAHPDKNFALYYDYLYNIWGVFSGYVPQHGGATYLKNFAFGSRIGADNLYGAIFRRVYQRSGNDFYRFFNDNCTGIEIALTLGFDDLDQPNVDKEFQWLRPYFAPIERPGFTPDPATSYYNSSPLVVTYKNYRFSDSSTALQDTFPGDADDWQAQSKVWRLRSELVKSLAISLYIQGSGNINKPFILTGYDMMVSPSTKADSISR